MANFSISCECAASSNLGVSATASVTAGTQSVGDNYTTINYSYSASRTGWTFTGTSRPNAGALVLVINGTTCVNVALPLNNGSTSGTGLASGSGSVRVYHNSDGTKAISVTFRIDKGSDPRGANYVWNGTSSTQSMTLNTIPRASYPSMSASAVTLGNSITINTNRKSTSFTHNLWWKCNSDWFSIATGVGDSYAWTTPKTIANYITNSTSGTVTILCRTFSGGAQIGGDQYTSFTANIPSDIVPSISNLSVWDANSNVSSKFGVYLKGASYLGISFTDAGSYGSSISSRKITANNQTFWNNTSATTDYLLSSGNLTVTVTTTDTRGRSASKQYTITVYDYGTPWVSSFKGIRCNSDGSVNDGGQYLKLQFEAGVYSVSNKNTAQYQLGYRITDSGNYTWKVLDITSLTYNNTTGVISGLTFSEEHSYDLILLVGDKLGNEARRSDTLATEFRLMDFYQNGTGMAIGKVAESSNLFDVGLNTKFRKFIYADNGIVPGDSTYYGAPIYGANNATAWVHLGTWTSGGDAHNCMITIFTGAGYNSNASQNTTIKINIKDGWQGSYSASGSFGITYEITGNYYSSIKVKGIAQAHNILDVWVYLPWTYWNGDYVFQGFGSWKHIATNQSAEPTGNEQSCAETAPAWVEDSKNGNKLTFSYYKDGMGLNDIDWLACWNGSELRAINKNQLEDSGYDSSSGWSWFKSQSGLMIQHKYQTFSKSWTAWGSLYSIDINKQADGTKEISDYAYKFTQTPTRLVSLADGSTVNAITAFPDCDGLKNPTQNFGGIIITRPNNVANTYVLSLMAIGWWK